jgi:hypothetical protein
MWLQEEQDEHGQGTAQALGTLYSRIFYLEEILFVTLYCNSVLSGKIRRYNGTAVMTIKEQSLIIAKEM